MPVLRVSLASQRIMQASGVGVLALFASYQSFLLLTKTSTVFSFRELVHRALVRCLPYVASFAGVPTSFRLFFRDAVHGRKALSIPPGHTHGESAALRTAAANSIHMLARLAGYELMCVNGSHADVRAGRNVHIEHYWVKDQDKPRVLKDFLSGSYVLSLVDVDYYMDMNVFLARNISSPVLLYTLVPHAAAHVGNDYSYRFERGNEITYLVHGGGSYRHQLWDYGSDAIIAVETVFGLGVRCTTYKVERENLDADHQVVCLVPMTHTEGIVATLLLQTTYQGKLLERFKPVHDDFVVITSQGEGGPKISIAPVGGFGCATISAAADTAIRSYAKSTTAPRLNTSSVRNLGNETSRLSAAEGAILADYYNSKVPLRTPVVYPIKTASRGYQWGTPSLYYEEEKPLMRAFTSPWYNAGFSPYNNAENEAAGVKGRITDVRSDKEATELLQRWMEDFAAEVFPTPGQLHPVDPTVVSERQPRPTQQRILEDAAADVGGIRTAFMKSEAYQEPKDPRLITQMAPRVKAEYSAFIYAFSDYVKENPDLFPWYAFGRPPVEVAARVAEIASESEFIHNTDFSRFDGRISPALRTLETILLHRGFAPRWRDEVCELHRTAMTGKIRTRHGVEYESGTARSSGSPETSLFNTMCSAFTMYCAVRMTLKTDGVFFNSGEAYSMLGLFGGDDGIQNQVPAKTLERASSQLGLKLTCETVERGHAGVQFLGRIYGPNVWLGDSASMCDIPRILAKLHLAVGDVHDPWVKLGEKAVGLRHTDPSTPFIGAWADAVLCHVPLAEVGPETSWFAREFDLTLQWPNHNDDDWCWAYAGERWPDIDLRFGEQWIAEGGSLLEPPVLAEDPDLNPKINIVVDGDDVPALSDQTQGAEHLEVGDLEEKSEEGEVYNPHPAVGGTSAEKKGSGSRKPKDGKPRVRRGKRGGRKHGERMPHHV